MANIDLGNEANERARRLIELRPFGKTTAAFVHAWRDSSRVPRTITFPEGLERTVEYIRDGILTFNDNGLAATYERVLDYPSETKAIVVYYSVNDPAVCN